MCEVLTHPLFSLFTLAVGSLVTWLCARHYYQSAANDLRDEAKKLRTATGWILYYLEHQPHAKIQVQRDDNGQVIGLIVSVPGQASMTFATGGILSDAGAS